MQGQACEISPCWGFGGLECGRREALRSLPPLAAGGLWQAGPGPALGSGARGGEPCVPGPRPSWVEAEAPLLEGAGAGTGGGCGCHLRLCRHLHNPSTLNSAALWPPQPPVAQSCRWALRGNLELECPQTAPAPEFAKGWPRSCCWCWGCRGQVFSLSGQSVFVPG